MLIIRWWCECVTFGFLHVVKQSAQGFNCSPMSRYLISSTSPCCVIIPPWNWLVASTQHALSTLRQRPFRPRRHLLRAWEQPALLLFFISSFFFVIFSKHYRITAAITIKCRHTSIKLHNLACFFFLNNISPWCWPRFTNPHNKFSQST